MIVTAQSAGETGHVMRREYPVAGFKPLDAPACLEDIPSHLVPQHGAGRDLLVEHLRDIGPAQPAGPDSDENLARTDLRHGHLYHSHVSIAIVHCSTHGT